MQHSVLGIDIGSTKICAIIANIDDGRVNVIGVGLHKSQGVKKGAITNIELASRAIKIAVNDAKRMAGVNPMRATISISGAYTKSINSSGIVSIPNSEISLKEISRVMQTALYNATVPSECDIIHILPYNFKVDEQDFIDDPLGMNGGRLEVSTHIVTAQKSSLSNLKKAVKAAGIEVDNIVLNAYASSIATLSAEEKELGVACIDMGGSTCNLMVHVGSSMRYNDFLSVGSNHITNDLSMALRTSPSAAEDVKIKYGSLLHREDNENFLEVPTLGGDGETSYHQVSLNLVDSVIRARVEETLMILAKSIEKSTLKEHINAGVVLTGGMVHLEGLRELASAIFFNLPVRIAKPIEVDGLLSNFKQPEFSTAVGLVLYTSGHCANYEMDSDKKLRCKSNTRGDLAEEIAPPPAPQRLGNLGNLGNATPLSEPRVLAMSAPQPQTLEKQPQQARTATNVRMVNHQAEDLGSRSEYDKGSVFSQLWRKITQMF